MNGSPALRISNLTKTFDGLRAVDDVDLMLDTGERRGIIGPNGAGKTTLFRLISGESKPTAGRVTFLGEDVTRMSAHRRARRGLARTYQITNIFLDLSVRENIELAAIRIEGLSYSPWWRRRQNIAARVERTIEVSGLSDIVDMRGDEVSHGEQRQIELALALTTDPSLLLLDEPAAGLSAAERAHMARTIEQLPRDITVCLIEHDMDFALGISDAVTCLHYGKVIATGTPEAISANDEVQSIYLGTRGDSDAQS